MVGLDNSFTVLHKLAEAEALRFSFSTRHSGEGSCIRKVLSHPSYILVAAERANLSLGELRKIIQEISSTPQPQLKQLDIGISDTADPVYANRLRRFLHFIMQPASKSQSVSLRVRMIQFSPDRTEQILEAFNHPDPIVWNHS